MRAKYVIGAAMVLSAAVGANASVIVTDRDDLTSASAQIMRVEPITGDPVYATEGIYSDFDTFTGLGGSSNTTSSSGTGSLMDTATGLALVVSTSGGADATSAFSIAPNGSLLYTVSGQYNSSITTGVLGGYTPPSMPPETDVQVQTGPGYNSGISFLIDDVPAEFTITVGQSNSLGGVFNAAILYKDANNDHNFNPGDGDELMQDYFVIGANGTETRTGTLEPSASHYRLLFFGNIFDAVMNDGVTQTSSADYTSSFTLAVPEPGSIAGIALLGVSALRRRRI